MVLNLRQNKISFPVAMFDCFDSSSVLWANFLGFKIKKMSKKQYLRGIEYRYNRTLAFVSPLHFQGGYSKDLPINKDATEVQNVLMQGAACFNEKLWDCLCLSPEQVQNDLEAAKRMQKNFIEEVKEWRAEEATKDTEPDKYYFEMCDMLFCAYGLMYSFSLDVLRQLEPLEQELFDEIAQFNIGRNIPIEYAVALCASNASKFFNDIDYISINTGEYPSYYDIIARYPEKNLRVCKSGDKFKTTMCIVNDNNKVMKFEGLYGYVAKETYLQKIKDLIRLFNYSQATPIIK